MGTGELLSLLLGLPRSCCPLASFVIAILLGGAHVMGQHGKTRWTAWRPSAFLDLLCAVHSSRLGTWLSQHPPTAAAHHAAHHERWASRRRACTKGTMTRRPCQSIGTTLHRDFQTRLIALDGEHDQDHAAR